MYCAHCGKPVKDDAKFCPACGYPTRLGKKLMNQKAGGNGSVPSVPANLPKVNVPSTLSSMDSQKKQLIAAVVVVALLAVGGGAYYFHTHDDKVAAVPSITQKADKLPSQKKSMPQKQAPAISKKDTAKADDGTSSPAAKPAPAKPVDPDKAAFADPDVKVDSTNPAHLFVYYHKNISNRNLQEAYNCFSDNYKGQMGAFSGWAAGYDTTLASIPQNVQVLSNDGQNATVSFRLKAVDKEGNGEKTQYFRGTAQLINVGGLWKINSIEARFE